jgi:hypothetical protein
LTPTVTYHFSTGNEEKNMISPETPIDVVAEIPRAIAELTKELREVRVALNAITEILEDVVHKSGGNYPGYIRVRQEQ